MISASLINPSVPTRFGLKTVVLAEFYCLSPTLTRSAVTLVNKFMRRPFVKKAFEGVFGREYRSFQTFDKTRCFLKLQMRLDLSEALTACETAEIDGIPDGLTDKKDIIQFKRFIGAVKYFAQKNNLHHYCLFAVSSSFLPLFGAKFAHVGLYELTNGYPAEFLLANVGVFASSFYFLINRVVKSHNFIQSVSWFMSQDLNSLNSKSALLLSQIISNINVVKKP